MASSVEHVELDSTLAPNDGVVVESNPPSATTKRSNRWRSRRPKASLRRRMVIWTIQVVIVAAFLGFWQHMASGSLTTRLTVSSPSDVFSWMGSWIIGNQAHGLEDLRVTLYEAAYGWLLGVVIGIVLAVILASSKWLRLFGAPFVSVFNAFPKIALAPLFILIYGQTLTSKVYFVAAGIFFITFYNVFSGIRSIDPIYVRNAKILGARPWHLMREVHAPAIVSWVMTSLRLTAAWSLTAAVIAEYLGSLKGMGNIVLVGQQTQAPKVVIGGILAVAIAALVIDRIIVVIERRFSRWRLS